MQFVFSVCLCTRFAKRKAKKTLVDDFDGAPLDDTLSDRVSVDHAPTEAPMMNDDELAPERHSTADHTPEDHPQHSLFDREQHG